MNNVLGNNNNVALKDQYKFQQMNTNRSVTANGEYILTDINFKPTIPEGYTLVMCSVTSSWAWCMPTLIQNTDNSFALSYITKNVVQTNNVNFYAYFMFERI